ncbi:MAG TPA: class II aldolase/adducin family protein [Pyrinomonadaceae bacterium]|nr:class II aldolase/adducin family protein [Pyrinomonadaceae bacterium]
MNFKQLREEVWWANTQLPKAGLVTMHSGNASGIDRESGLILIKPSGIDYERLRPEDLSVVALNGTSVNAELVPDRVSSSLKPSVDTIHHLLLYKADAQLGGVVHTHSNYATAWAAIGESIPCCLTAIADEFGGDIPCAPYLDNEGENIASGMLKHRGRGPAMLLSNHGVFAFAATPRKALKAAVMVEDVAKTAWLARQLGRLKRMEDSEIEKWWSRYHSTYGQE